MLTLKPTAPLHFPRFFESRQQVGNDKCASANVYHIVGHRTAFAARYASLTDVKVLPVSPNSEAFFARTLHGNARSTDGWVKK